MAQVNEHIRYEPDERPPHSIAAGVGFQAAVVIIAPGGAQRDHYCQGSQSAGELP